MSDLPANGAWLAWLVAAIFAAVGAWGLFDGTFAIPLPGLNRVQRRPFRRVVGGPRARAIALAYVGIAALTLVSLKAGAIAAGVLAVVGWVLGTPDPD